MKSQTQNIVNAVIACLLFGASGAAMARNDCPGGSIVGGEFDEIVINEFVSCTVVGAVVNGNVRVRNADQFSIKGGIVNGNVRVTNVVSAFVSGGNIIVSDDACEQDQEVAVVQNLIFVGSMRVNCNEKADVKENKVTSGDITCRDNDRLDSKDNDAFGGRVNCSLSLL